MNDHPITPPPELVQKWISMLEYCEDIDVFSDIAQWGADKELEACEKYWMTHGISPEGVVRMREARRPKPPSLKQQAMDVLKRSCFVNPVHENIIRRALEQLDD